MYFYKRGKSKKGFILVYTLMIVSLCMAAALGSFKMQCIKRNNNINLRKDISRQDTVQRDREYLLTEMDSFICSNVKNINTGSIKELFSAKGDYKSCYDKSYIMYLKDKDVFYLCFYCNGSFLMEELYRYVEENGSVAYIPSEYSYKQGVLAN